MKTVGAAISHSDCEVVSSSAPLDVTVWGSGCRVTFPDGTVSGFAVPLVTGGSVVSYTLFDTGGGWVDLVPSSEVPGYYLLQLGSSAAPAVAGAFTRSSTNGETISSP